MYCFVDGWMVCGSAKGLVRLQLFPLPMCERWDAKAKFWGAHRPPHLFLEEARDFRARLQVAGRQLELPMSGESNPVDSPYREDAGFPAYRLWLYAPELWGELASRFQGTSWEMLSFVAACGSAAVDLTVSNPGIAIMLAAKYFGKGWYLHPENAEALRKALRLPQIKLLPWIMLPQERWIVRFLSKLRGDVKPDKVLTALRSLLQLRGAEEMFRHLKSIDERVLRVIHPKILPVISPRFLMDLTGTKGLDSNMDVIVWKLQNAGNLTFNGREVPVFETLRHLERWHWEELGMKGKYSHAFPQAPFHGDKHIRAITNLHMLQEESHELQHCVMDYRARIELGEFAVYAVLHPERATLGLIRNQDGQWRIFDLRLSHNRPPSPETRKALDRWLRESQRKQTPF